MSPWRRSRPEGRPASRWTTRSPAAATISGPERRRGIRPPPAAHRESASSGRPLRVVLEPDVVRPARVDVLQFAEGIDVARRALEVEDAPAAAVAGGEAGPVPELVEDPVRLAVQLREDQRLRHPPRSARRVQRGL